LLKARRRPSLVGGVIALIGGCGHHGRAEGLTTPGGKLIFHIFGSLAEFERDLIRERTHAGLAAARARGRLGGRPKKLADAKQLELAQTLYDGGQTDIATICSTLGISRATLYRSLTRRKGGPPTPR